MGQPDSIFDLVDEDRKARAIAEARADVLAGRVTDNATVARWLDEAAKALEAGRPIPPPPLARNR